MRAYLAVIQDSFREALASRVLWVLLVLITLLLLVVLPVGYREQATRNLGEGDVRDWPHFIERLRDQSQQPQPSPAKRIVALLDEPLRRDVLAFAMPHDSDVSGAFKMVRLFGSLRTGLNRLLQRRDFYDAEAWGKTRPRTDEGRELAKQKVATMSADELGRWNRLMLEAAFPEFVTASLPTSLRFRYLGYDVGEPFPMRKAEFQRLLESVVEYSTDWLVGTLGVFVAILVTASIIPQTLDPGSLNLLLSKPVRRWLLFLAKFFGGCMFTLLNASYLVIGFWLILGLRFALWNPRLLLSIPVYVFVFAIYYTVSALVGLLWRNAIVCVALTMVFGLLCRGIGGGKLLIEQWMLNKTRLVQLISAKDTLLGVNEMGMTYAWDAKLGQWREVFRSDSEEALQRRMALAVVPTVPAELRPLGPVYDERGDQLISAARSFRTGQMRLTVGPRAKDWIAVDGASASLGSIKLLRETDGRILMVSNLGLYRLEGNPQHTSQPVQVFGFAVPFTTRDPFVSVGPDKGLTVDQPADAAVNQDTGELALYSRGQLMVLRKNAEARYELRVEKKLPGDYRGPAVLACGGDTVLVGREDGEIAAYDAQTLELRRQFSVEGKNQPRFVTAAPGGKHFAVVFHHGTLWVYGRDANAMTRPPLAGQRDLSCSVFSAPGRMLAVDRGTRVTEYELPAWRPARRYAPPLTVMERAYYYGFSPLYTVFPKPGELDKTVQYILSGKETAETDRRGDLSTAQKHLHPWRPVWSSLAFMVVVLTLGCLYVQRQDY